MFNTTQLDIAICLACAEKLLGDTPEQIVWRYQRNPIGFIVWIDGIITMLDIGDDTNVTKGRIT